MERMITLAETYNKTLASLNNDIDGKNNSQRAYQPFAIGPRQRSLPLAVRH